MKRRTGWIERLAAQTDMHDELFPNQPLVEIMGSGRVLVEKHCGVTLYASDEICVRMRYGAIQIIGSSLELTQMTDQQLVVSGRVDGVNILRRN